MAAMPAKKRVAYVVATAPPTAFRTMAATGPQDMDRAGSTKFGTM